MLVHLKGVYTLLGKIDSKPEGQKFSFKVPLEDKSIVEVEIIPDMNSIESFRDFEVSKEMWDIMQTDLFDGNKLELHLKNELSMMTSSISDATRKVLNIIKYCFYQKMINEELFSVKGYFWSKNKSKWKRLPMITSGSVDYHKFLYLKDSTAGLIQDYIDIDFEPFLALRHLHRAKNESNPRYKYIDATIAAELAIKEFLIRIYPDIETLLLDVPSPPLHKLYGSILESFTNIRSPKYKEIQKGVEIRNKLVHRPKDIDIDQNQANKYVQDIEIAIFHLLTLIYRYDEVLKNFCKPEIVLNPV